MADPLRASAGDATGMRESYGAYIARTTFIDPEKDAEDARLRQEAALHRAARGMFKQHVRAMQKRSATAAKGERGKPRGRASRRRASTGDPRAGTGSQGSDDDDGSPLAATVERRLEKQMATDLSGRRALIPGSAEASLPSFADAKAPEPARWEAGADAAGLLGAGEALPRLQTPVRREAARRASRMATSPEGATIVGRATHVMVSPGPGGVAAPSPQARRSTADDGWRASPASARGRRPQSSAAAERLLRPPPPRTAPATGLPELPAAAKSGMPPPTSHRPGSRATTSASASASRGGPRPAPASARGKPSTPRPRTIAARAAAADDLPRLVGDKSLPDAPLDALRIKRWRELRFLHALMVRHGRSLEDLAELFGTRDHLRRSHFTVIMTGFLGLNGWAMDPHFAALFDGFDLSNKAAVDPREIVCGLNFLDKPADEVVSVICYGFAFFAARVSYAGDGEATVGRERMLSLIFSICANQAEEDALRASLGQVVEAFERFTGDPLPARVTNKQMRRALFYAPKFQDEFRRVWMRRLPDNVRMAILRRTAERASLEVQAHERALNVHKATIFLRDKIRPQILVSFFSAWVSVTKDAAHLRDLEERADGAFFRRSCARTLRRWKRASELPAKRAVARGLFKERLLRRCFRKLRMRWLPYHLLKTHAVRKEREEVDRVHARAMVWRGRQREKQDRDLLQAGFWAVRQEYRRRMRYRRAQAFRTDRLMRNQFVAWHENVRETVTTRHEAESRRAAQEGRARDRVRQMLEDQREAEAAAVVEAERAVAEQREYDLRMKQQRRRAAIMAAFTEATRSMAMRRTFRRKRAFNRLTRRGLKLWDAEKPAKLEARRQELWTWLHETEEGKAEIGELVTHILGSLQSTAVPVHLSGGKEGAGGDTPRDGAAAGAAAVVPKGSVKGPGGQSMHVRADTVGTREREPWQLNYKYKEAVRQWVNIKTGEAAGPPRNKAGLPAMTDALARRVAVENYVAIREPYLEAAVDADFSKFSAAASKHGHAYIIQDFFRTYQRVKTWKWLKEQAVRAQRSEAAVARARVRKAAILTIQCAWRCRAARAEVLWRLQGAWSVCVDLSSMAPYYSCAATGQSRWDTPPLLAHLSLWNWHHDRARRTAMMSEAAREAYWADDDFGGEQERQAAAVLQAHAEGLVRRRLRRALEVMHGTGSGEAGDGLSGDPVGDLGFLPRAGVPPVPQLRCEPEEGVAGHCFRYETGEMSTAHPPGYILCETCSLRFVITYVAEEDSLFCAHCFLERHDKARRADVAGFVLAPGPYLTSFQAPTHVNRTPQQLFGEKFTAPFSAMQHRRANPRARTFLLITGDGSGGS